MLISEKQIMQLMDYCRALAMHDLRSLTASHAVFLLDQITNQQPGELKIIE